MHTFNHTTAETIHVSDLDENLGAELDAPGFEFYSIPEFNDDGFRTGNSLHVAWHPEARRAGLVFVGSGSSGRTVWTDAITPADAVRRYTEDDILN